MKGRIIDLSPATARQIGLDRQDGIATVVVAPIEVPLPDGGVKRGAGTGDRRVTLEVDGGRGTALCGPVRARIPKPAGADMDFRMRFK